MVEAWRRMGRAEGLTLLALALLSLAPLVLQVPNPRQMPWLASLHNALHTPLFFVIQCLLLRLTGQRWPQLACGWRILLAAAVGMSLGGTVEVLQGMIGRDASWLDMQRNMMGICAASAGYWGLRGRPHILSARVCVALSGLLLVLPFIGVWQHWRANQHQLQTFPQLLSAHTGAMQRHWLAVAGAEVHWLESAESPFVPPFLQVRLPGDRRWPGLMLVHPVADWSDFGGMYFEVYSKHRKTARIAINVYTDHSLDQPRLYQQFRLEPGHNRLRMAFPDNALNRERVIRVLWHSLSQGDDLHLYFANIHLN